MFRSCFVVTVFYIRESFFGYGHEESTANHFMNQAYVSARRIKALNPTTNITVVCNPGVTPHADGVFDMVRGRNATQRIAGVVTWRPNDRCRWLNTLGRWQWLLFFVLEIHFETPTKWVQAGAVAETIATHKSWSCRRKHSTKPDCPRTLFLWRWGAVGTCSAARQRIHES